MSAVRDAVESGRDLREALRGKVPFPTPDALVHHHSHNDYLHASPLVDALRFGFTSVEVDVWRTKALPDELQVGLSWGDVSPPRPHRTLRVLYLEPLRAHLEATNGEPFPLVPGTRLQLLIDLKVCVPPGSVAPEEGVDDDEHARRRGYDLLDSVLGEYADIITAYGADGALNQRPVQVVVTGDRPDLTYIHGQPQRYSTADGRLNFLDEEDSDFAQAASLVPMISGKYDFNFRFPTGLEADEAAALASIYRRARRNGQRVRFWGAPDDRVTWRRLLEIAGEPASGHSPAIISTNCLSEFRRFIYPDEVPFL